MSTVIYQAIVAFWHEKASKNLRIGDMVALNYYILAAAIFSLYLSKKKIWDINPTRFKASPTGQIVLLGMF